MNLDTLLADAVERSKKCVENCNAAARKMMRHLEPFTKKSPRDLLEGETDVLWNVQVELAAAYSELREAVKQVDALKRRGQ